MKINPNDALEDGINASSSLENRTKEGGDALEDEDSPDVLDDNDWKKIFKSCLSAATDYQDTKLRSKWSKNYRAFNNQHISNSKYNQYRYRHRSKLFRPKTRMAVRKNDATAASALFSTADVVSVEARRKSDRRQVMTARFVHAALNYRLDEGTHETGPNWFLTALGARQDSQITGVCLTKQYWEFEEREVQVYVEKPVLDVNGLPVIDPETGQGMVEEDIATEYETTRDRLMIDNIPVEHGFIDPTSDWRDPVQSGGFFAAGFPMRRDDLENTIVRNASRPRLGGGAWRADIDLKRLDEALKSSDRTRRSDRVRRAREDGIDRYESRHAGEDADIIWLYEFFYRHDGEDWHYWMLGENIILSDPRPVKESYPEQKGARPYVMGVGALEAHKPHPMAPVESWQPLQHEMNDMTNLALDARKMAISPITKIKRGKNIDWKQVQNRGPDAAIMVENEDDVTFDRAPGPDGGEQLAMNNLNVDFDELAGVFSTGSVQTNRQLNETVGGMQLMQGSSNNLTEFDLRIWAETWVEPCLRQCVNLIQYYESDETVMAVAGENAGLILAGQKPKPKSLDAAGAQQEDQQQPQEQQEPDVTFEEVMATFADLQVSVRVNIGIGALDSKQKLDKMLTGVKATMEMAPLLKEDGIVPNTAEITNEIWGLLGYKDGDRFFRRKDPGKEPPPPEVQKMQMEMKIKEAEFKAEQERMKQEAEFARQEHEFEMQKQRMDMLSDMIRNINDQNKALMAIGQPPLPIPPLDQLAAQLPGPGGGGGGGKPDPMMMALMQQMQKTDQALAMIAQAMTAPKTVTTPDGRQFTARAGV